MTNQLKGSQVRGNQVKWNYSDQRFSLEIVKIARAFYAIKTKNKMFHFVVVFIEEFKYL